MDQNHQAIKMNRFTMLVKEMNTYGTQVGLKGKPYGEFPDTGALYLCRSNMPVVKIENSIAQKDGDLLEICVESGYVPENIINGVITNVEPQGGVNVGTPIENPFLLGLAREYKDNYKDKDFTNEFCYTLVHAKFVVPCISDELGNEAGKITKGTKVGFPMLNVGQTDKKVLPVFTDWGAFAQWKDYLAKEKMAKVLILKFDDLADIATKNSDGFVINPFSEPVPVPPVFIENIMKSDGYQSEKNVTKRTIDKNTPIKIGIPQETEKIRLTRDALADFGGKNDLVKEIYLFAKNESGETNLLIVFDLDFSVTEEERKKVFDDAYRAMLPAIGREMKAEFAMKAPAFIKLCSNYEPFYKA